MLFIVKRYAIIEATCAPAELRPGRDDWRLATDDCLNAKGPCAPYVNQNIPYNIAGTYHGNSRSNIATHIFKNKHKQRALIHER